MPIPIILAIILAISSGVAYWKGVTSADAELELQKGKYEQQISTLKGNHIIALKAKDGDIARLDISNKAMQAAVKEQNDMIVDYDKRYKESIAKSKVAIGLVNAELVAAQKRISQLYQLLPPDVDITKMTPEQIKFEMGQCRLAESINARG